ncbi:MAG: capsular biosynthesis protein, partial [Spirochaetia bacterium]|nr:capsular biosynthesis protein [Spirochaetia bacterium]
YKYALPNKFFEFVQARLAIAIGDSFEMKQYVKKYDLGIAADENSAEALAKEIIKLSKDDIMRYKQNAHKYARELSAETNMVELRKIADELLR